MTLLAAGSSPIDLPEGTPWWAAIPFALVVMTSPWWGPALADRLRGRRPASTATEPRGETAKPDPADIEDDELRKLRDTLIEVLQDLQAKSRQAEQLARDLQARDLEVAKAHERAEQLARELADLRPEVMRLRDQVDALIGRRERTPPRGHPEVTESMPRPER